MPLMLLSHLWLLNCAIWERGVTGVYGDKLQVQTNESWLQHGSFCPLGNHQILIEND